MQCLVQRLGRGEVAAKRFLNDHARTLMATGTAQSLGDRREQIWRNGQVIQRTLRITERLSQLLIRLGIVVVAIHVLQARRQRRKGAWIHTAVRFDTLSRSLPERVHACRRSRHPDDRHIEIVVLNHRLESREYLPVGQVASRAQKDERVRFGICHVNRGAQWRTCDCPDSDTAMPFSLRVHRTHNASPTGADRRILPGRAN